MRISVLDISDVDGLRELHRAGLVAHRHDRPGAPFWGEAEVLAMFRADDPEERLVPLLVRDDDETVLGSAVVFVPLLDNLDKVYAAMSVVPERRGRGVGDALVEEIQAVARTECRTVVLVEGHFPVDADDSHPVRAFALRHGFMLANTEVRRTLQLPIDDTTVRDWADEAACHHEGYEIETFVDIVPVELRPSFVDLVNQLMLDAPTGDIDFEAGGTTVEIYEQQAQQRRETGRKLLITVAVRDGAAVAHSTLSIPPGDQELPHMSQWGTYVHRGHRGHRLGMATKARNLMVVQRDHPERTLLHTTNSPMNGPMVSINEAMGFVPNEVLGEFMRRL
ncbi:MAG: GNAT family N-acetyltransferase [Nocardioides sp.]